MAGHSHWNNIKRKKEAEDAKRGKLFTKLARAITHTAREGGGDPEFNPSLSDAIERAKSFNMPKDNIERAIKRGIGELEGQHMVEKTYEGYGPAGEAYVIKTLTDNINRTVAEIRHVFSQFDGSLGTAGSAAYIFEDSLDNPSFTIPIDDEKMAEKVISLAEALDDHDDVQDVYSNFDIND